jgi:LysR family nitrogen assimilation transcriptional regulator
VVFLKRGQVFPWYSDAADVLCPGSAGEADRAMNYQHLKTFLLVCELGSISRVAAKTGLAQPALSRQLKLLEADIGSALFVRQSFGMKLTRAGEHLLNSIEAPFQALEQAFADVRQEPRNNVQKVTLGLSPNISSVLSRRIIGRVSSTLPWIALHILEEYANELHEALKRGDLDLGIMHSSVGARASGLRELPVAFERLLLVTNHSQQPKSPGDVAIQDLRNFRLILPPKGHGIRELIDKTARAAGLTLQPAIEISSLSSIKELVESGDGCAVLTQSAVFRELADRRLSSHAIGDSRLNRSVIIALPKNSSMNRGVKAVLRIAREEISSLIRSGEWQATLAESSEMSASPATALS